MGTNDIVDISSKEYETEVQSYSVTETRQNHISITNAKTSTKEAAKLRNKVTQIKEVALKSKQL